MKYIRTMTQQKLSFWLALYIGWFMNVPFFSGVSMVMLKSYRLERAFRCVELVAPFWSPSSCYVFCRCLAAVSGAFWRR
jgi:glucan phosphoethanolaminetransferase (alkaline phosphatase superfamily)